MVELVKITTDGQGSSVVSARELYTFLGFDNSQWARWSKKNILNNPFATVGEDFTTLDMMSNASTDYALTLDFAKRLAMLARTEKGEQVRRYFIECENQQGTAQTSTLPPATSTEQLLVQLIAGQQEILQQLKADVDQIKQERQQLPSLPAAAGTPPHMKKRHPAPSAPIPLRVLVAQQINEYCLFHGAKQGETYTYLYKRMYDAHGINVYRLARTGKESLIDVLERHGHLDRLYALIVSELTCNEDY